MENMNHRFLELVRCRRWRGWTNRVTPIPAGLPAARPPD
jgi:hypothetical protein